MTEGFKVFNLDLDKESKDFTSGDRTFVWTKPPDSPASLLRYIARSEEYKTIDDIAEEIAPSEEPDMHEAVKGMLKARREKLRAELKRLFNILLSCDLVGIDKGGYRRKPGSCVLQPRVTLIGIEDVIEKFKALNNSVMIEEEKADIREWMDEYHKATMTPSAEREITRIFDDISVQEPVSSPVINFAEQLAFDFDEAEAPVLPQAALAPEAAKAGAATHVSTAILTKSGLRGTLGGCPSVNNSPDNEYPHPMLPVELASAEPQKTNLVVSAEVAPIPRNKKEGNLSKDDKSYKEYLANLIAESFKRYIGKSIKIGEASDYSERLASALIRYDQESLESLANPGRGILTEDEVRLILSRRRGCSIIGINRSVDAIIAILDGYEKANISIKNQKKLLAHFFTIEEMSSLRASFPELPNSTILYACINSPKDPRKFLRNVIETKNGILGEKEFEVFKEQEWAVLRACVHNTEGPREFLRNVIKKKNGILSEKEFETFKGQEGLVLYACVCSKDTRKFLRDAITAKNEILSKKEFKALKEQEELVLCACVNNPTNTEQFLRDAITVKNKILSEEEFKRFTEWTVFYACVHNPNDPRKLLRSYKTETVPGTNPLSPASEPARRGSLGGEKVINRMTPDPAGNVPDAPRYGQSIKVASETAEAYKSADEIHTEMRIERILTVINDLRKEKAPFFDLKTAVAKVAPLANLKSSVVARYIRISKKVQRALAQWKKDPVVNMTSSQIARLVNTMLPAAFAKRLNGVTKDMEPNKLCKLLNVGVATATNWLSGYSLPSAENMMKLAREFQVSVCYLMTGMKISDLLNISIEDTYYGRRLLSIKISVLADEERLSREDLCKKINLYIADAEKKISLARLNNIINNAYVSPKDYEIEAISKALNIDARLLSKIEMPAQPGNSNQVRGDADRVEDPHKETFLWLRGELELLAIPESQAVSIEIVRAIVREATSEDAKGDVDKVVSELIPRGVHRENIDRIIEIARERVRHTREKLEAPSAESWLEKENWQDEFIRIAKPIIEHDFYKHLKLYRIRSIDLNDIKQEAIYRFSQYLNTLKQRQSEILNLDAYVGRMIRNLIIDIRKKRTDFLSFQEHETGTIAYLDSIQPYHYGEDPLHQMEIDEIKSYGDILARAFKSIPVSQKQREIFEAVYIKGESATKFAARKGIPRGTVTSAVSRTIEQFAKYFKEQGISRRDLEDAMKFEGANVAAPSAPAPKADVGKGQGLRAKGQGKAEKSMVNGPSSMDENKPSVITREEIASAVDFINSKGEIFNFAAKGKIVDKVFGMRLVKGSSFLVVGPGFSDYLSILLTRLGLSVSIIDTDASCLSYNIELQKELGMENQIASFSSYSDLGGRKFDYISVFAVLHDVVNPVKDEQLRIMAKPGYIEYFEDGIEKYCKEKMASVITDIVKHLKPGGNIFINDIKSPPAEECQGLPGGSFMEKTFYYLDNALQKFGAETGIEYRQVPDIDINDFSINTGYPNESRTGVVYQALPVTPQPAPAPEPAKGALSSTTWKVPPEQLEQSGDTFQFPQETVPGANLGESMVHGPSSIEKLIADIDARFKAGLATQPFAQDQEIWISESLFEDAAGIDHLKGLLSNKKFVRIAPFDEIKNAVANTKKHSPDKFACVVTNEELQRINKVYHFDQKDKSALGATMLPLADNLSGDNYLYLEGVVGLSKAMMDRNETSMRSFMELLFGVADESLIQALIKDEGFVSVALSAMLKFKPIEKIDTEEDLDKYKKSVEDALIAA